MHSPEQTCFRPFHNHPIYVGCDAGRIREQMLYFLRLVEIERTTAYVVQCVAISTGVGHTDAKVGRRHMINDLLFHPPTVCLSAFVRFSCTLWKWSRVDPTSYRIPQVIVSSHCIFIRVNGYRAMYDRTEIFDAVVHSSVRVRFTAATGRASWPC